MAPPEHAMAFGRDVARVLRSTLADRHVGTYFVGSVALGGYVSGESDIDIIGVASDAVDAGTREELVERLQQVTATCPARGLEFTLYSAPVASSARADAAFEVNVNGGPRMEPSVHRSPSDEPRFWYVLDRAIAHRFGIAIDGPPASEVFADVPRHMLLEMMAESMRWHRQHEKATLYSVLNACRAWRFAVDDVLGSKLEGAEWARSRWSMPSVIDAAVELRHGRAAPLDAEDVDRLLDHVARVLDR